jgi:hypothetical protein
MYYYLLTHIFYIYIMLRVFSYSDYFWGKLYFPRLKVSLTTSYFFKVVSPRQLKFLLLIF